MTKDQFKMLSKRELKATKIHAPEYKPTGGCFPKAGDSPAAVLENILYIKCEIIRWYESLAWVSDKAEFREVAVRHLHLYAPCCSALRGSPASFLGRG